MAVWFGGGGAERKEDFTTHFVIGGLTTWNQVTDFHCTAITRTVLKEKYILIFFG